MYKFSSEVLPGLAKVQEETAELNVVLAKLIGTGGDWDYFDGTDLRAECLKEIADVFASLDFFVWNNFGIGEDLFIDARKKKKMALYEQWKKEGN